MRTILLVLMMSSACAHASLSVSPTMINFFNVPVNGFAGNQTITVMNMGPDATNVTVNNGCFGDFFTSGFCGLTLNPNMSCNISVQFSPHHEGYQSCSISITAANGPFYSVNVTGNGVHP